MVMLPTGAALNDPHQDGIARQQLPQPAVDHSHIQILKIDPVSAGVATETHPKARKCSYPSRISSKLSAFPSPTRGSPEHPTDSLANVYNSLDVKK